ncbi:hypothetical protein LVJ94_15450 [Pendulispora rubella]|uniref:Glycosyltransferase RgtA/B/C/D-like domain-containing protein n=1 Tax=Pendulispora rubella TaxID=2741070 RepID=A0ABZ2LCH5_9BACT
MSDAKAGRWLPDFRAQPRWVQAVSAAALLAGVVHFFLVVWVFIERRRSPIELEWMSGGVSDHIERILAGKPLYVAPGAEFIPYIYPPLHLWLSAGLASFMPIATASALVSIVATCAAGALVHRASRKLGAGPYWSAMAVALFLGAYSYTGYWYDLDRSDSLTVALLLGALVVALGTESTARMAAAGALLAAAFFAKQPALIFFVVAVAVLLLVRRVRAAVSMSVGWLVVWGPALAILTLRSDGWFWFYCLKMPAAHGISSKLITVFFVIDATDAFAISAAAVAVLTRLGRATLDALRKVSSPPETNDALLFAFVLAALLTSAASRLHVGGHRNVLVFFTTFGSIAFAVTSSRLTAAESSSPVVRGLLAAAALLQLGHFLYDPGEAIPTSRNVSDARMVEARVRELEKKGDVLMPGRGHVTAQRHFHVMALVDVLRAGLPLPEDLVTGLRERKYAAYVLDDFDELTLELWLGHRSDELYQLVLRNYFVAERLDDRQSWPVIGWKARPSWILRPRRMPLTELPIEAVEQRRRIEMSLAEMRMREVQAGAAKVNEGDDIEERAAQLVRSPE